MSEQREPLRDSYLEMMRAHVDEGGTLNHANGVALLAEVERLRSLLNTPETADWFKGVELEAAHQQERWGSAHDAGKTALDWFWLIGYLAQKAAYARIAGDDEKAKHHTISTGAALLNWYRQISGATGATMRPGIGLDEQQRVAS